MNTTETGENFEHYWSKMVGASRANDGLRAGWLEQLQEVQDNCGFEYVRFNGLFHDDMFPVVEEKGKIVYNWQYIDDLFDRMLDLNVKPFVELHFCQQVWLHKIVKLYSGGKRISLLTLINLENGMI
ncbi:GH39 family glycosyl hydrolase [Formosa sp. PL04]|uniref:GH39 family glycosyl hydrolase n=1 Tax=Formosa sp. PL04 TaxID=3081755 RepID=UPI0039967EBC